MSLSNLSVFYRPDQLIDRQKEHPGHFAEPSMCGSLTLEQCETGLKAPQDDLIPMGGAQHPAGCASVLPWRNPDTDAFFSSSCPSAGAWIASHACRSGTKLEQQSSHTGPGPSPAATNPGAKPPGTDGSGAHPRTPCTAPGCRHS